MNLYPDLILFNIPSKLEDIKPYVDMGLFDFFLPKLAKINEKGN